MIFVDAGALIARRSARDEHHERATERWKALKSARERLVTSSLAAAEALDFFASWAPRELALKEARAFVVSQDLEILRPTESDEQAALRWFERLGAQRVRTAGRKMRPIGWTDCISFALMEARGLTTAFAFDGHFRLAGFAIYGED